MKNRLQKTLSLCLTMLLLMSAVPFPAAVAEASEPIPQEETAPVENTSSVEEESQPTPQEEAAPGEQAEAPSVEAAPEENQQAEEAIEQPTEEPTAAQPEQPTEEATAAQPTAEPTAEQPEQPTAEPAAEQPEQPTAEPTAEATPEASQATAEPTADPIAAFFGIASIEGNEDFYRALYAYSLGRAGGMPLTIQLTGSETATFDGAKHQKVYTAGSITTTVAMPDYYTVTFEAKAAGRIPGTYSPQLSGISVWDSKNNVNMTSFFDPMVTGGGLEITASGSLLMISADNVEIEFNGFYQELVATTGQAYINWMPMSDELRLTLRATVAGHPYLPDTYAMSMETYAVEVIEDGTDITEYFEYKFASTGNAVITPPSQKIQLKFDYGDIELEYTGWDPDLIATAEKATIWESYVAEKPLPDELRVSAVGKPVTVVTRSTGGAGDYMYNISLYAVDYSVETIEGGTDITEYFEYWNGRGRLIITPPAEPIPIVFQPDPIVLQYTGKPLTQQSTHASMYLNGELFYYQQVSLVEIGSLGLDLSERNFVEPGVYEITQDDWMDVTLRILWYGYGGYYAPDGYHDITILPTTLTILAP